MELKEVGDYIEGLIKIKTVDWLHKPYLHIYEDPEIDSFKIWILCNVWTLDSVEDAIESIKRTARKWNNLKSHIDKVIKSKKEYYRKKLDEAIEKGSPFVDEYTVFEISESLRYIDNPDELLDDFEKDMVVAISTARKLAKKAKRGIYQFKKDVVTTFFFMPTDEPNPKEYIDKKVEEHLSSLKELITEIELVNIEKFGDVYIKDVVKFANAEEKAGRVHFNIDAMWMPS